MNFPKINNQFLNLKRNRETYTEEEENKANSIENSTLGENYSELKNNHSYPIYNYKTILVHPMIYDNNSPKE